MRLLKQQYHDRKGNLQQSAKWYVEFTDHNDVVRRVPAFSDEKLSGEFGRNIQRLVEHRRTNQTPDGALNVWLGGLPGATLARLGALQLLDSRRVAASVPFNPVQNGDRL